MNKYIVIGIIIVVALLGFFFFKREVAQAPTDQSTDTQTEQTTPSTSEKKDLPPTMETGTVDSSGNPVY